ncbi:MAG: methyltransferase domain-containing protein [Streptococcaceae bacterium]|jgi:23S rRNA (guanine745-N1)-methyltransferase|nr:methyltransferase domain-containing protein [Streptococcaceae bacterium]
MQKKIVLSKEFLEKHHNLFRCPICKQKMSMQNFSFQCENRHQFDLSKKGTLYFLSKSIETPYKKEMFLHRRALIQSGMYQPLIEEIRSEIRSDATLLDVGSGEGSFTQLITKEAPHSTAIGFDISKDGVFAATNLPFENDTFFCVADLTHLPFSDAAFDIILNIFSPSAYHEFSRVLKPNGKLIKVIPESEYLIELRNAFYPDDHDKQSYSNESVLKRLKQEAVILKEKRITYTYPVPLENRISLLEMSPLEWGADAEIKKSLQSNPLDAITVDVRLLICEVNSKNGASESHS